MRSPKQITISQTEKAIQRFEAERLSQTVRADQEDGYLILENCVACDHAETPPPMIAMIHYVAWWNKA